MNLSEVLPQVFILSTQRSGTHLLESFLSNHQQISTRGEFLRRYWQQKTIALNIPGKLNIGIVMYNQVTALEDVGGRLCDHKIIHLLRDPLDVAKSRLQARANKEVLGDAYRAHLLQGEIPFVQGLPNFAELEDMAKFIKSEQDRHIEMLTDVPHVLVRYEDILRGAQSASVLPQDIVVKVLSFLDLDSGGVTYSTNFVRTGIRSVD